MGEIGSVQIADNAGAIVDRLHEHLKSSKLARPLGSGIVRLHEKIMLSSKRIKEPHA
jgi:hypothetical protein